MTDTSEDGMMKVVINGKHGGFGLSDSAVEYCLTHGMTATVYDDETREYADPEADFCRHGEPTDDLTRALLSLTGSRYSAVGDKYSNELRCHPVVVAAVEELGSEAASGRFSRLKVVEIPFDGPDGWEIDGYDGLERVVESHRSWS